MAAASASTSRSPQRHRINEALRSLDAGLSALFSCPTTSKAHSTSTHPLCECVLLPPPPRAFRWLRRLPVLKRRAIAAWKLQIDQLGTPLTRTAAATTSFCVVLAQCGLLHPREAEVLRLLVDNCTPELLTAVLTASSTHSRSLKPLLPLRTRLLLASTAFSTKTDGQAQWTAEVAAKLADELMQAAVLSVPPPEEETETELCAFCSTAYGVASTAVQADGDTWEFISSAVQQLIASLQGDKDRLKSTKTANALVALRNAIVTSGVASRDAPASIRALSTSVNTPSSAPTTSLSKQFLASLNQDHYPTVALSTRDYQQISWGVVQAADRVNSGSTDGLDPPRLASMWALAWQKEFQRRRESSVVHLPEIVMDCARADAFALAAAGQSPLQARDSPTTRLVGCQVVLQVIATTEEIAAASVISALAQVWAQCESSMAQTLRSPSSVTISTAVKTLCVVYLERTLPRAGRLSLTPSQSQGRTLLESLGCVSLMASGHHEASHWTDLWDLTLLFHDQSWPSAHGLESDGLRWCSAIKACVLAASKTDEPSTSSAIHRGLRSYCLGIVHGILTTGGGFISSGERFQRPLIQEVADREPVQQLLLTMLEHFDQEWMERLLLQALQSLARTSDSAGDSQLWLGIRTLLFPATAVRLRVVSDSGSDSHYQASHGLFVDTLRSVSERLQREEFGDEYVSALLAFCCSWDEFLLSQEKQTRRSSDVTTAGTQAVAAMGIYPELIERYRHSQGAISREKTSVLLFLSEVLQRASDCPRSLEAQLFDLVNRIAEVVSAKETPSVGFMTDKQDDRPHHVSHSSEALQAVFHASSTADAAKMREAVRRLETSDHLDQLVQQLKRWVVMIEAEPDAVGREARLEFAVLCNRLMYWAPDQTRGLQLLATRVSGRVAGAVKAVKRLARRPRTPPSASTGLGVESTLMPTLVRVEMATRSYLQAGSLPDLCGLTTLLVETVVRCEKKSVRDELAVVVQRFSSVLILESVLLTLSRALKSIQAFNSVFESTKAAIASSRRAVRALDLLSSDHPAFGLPALTWSSSLFDGELATRWLPFFWDFVLGTGVHPASDTLVKSVVNSIIMSLNRDDNNDDDDRANLFQTSYWLVAMLSAVQFANRLQLVAVLDADQEQYGTLQSVLAAVMAKLTVVSTDREVKINSDVLVVWQNPMRVGRASVIDDKLVLNDGVLILDDDVDEAVGEIFFDYTADETTEAPGIPTVGLLLSFSQWFAAATAFSQAFKPSNDPSRSLAMQAWERTFLFCANDLYLPLEFANNAFSVAKAWMSAWLSRNLSRGESESFLHALPFQVAWFQRKTRVPKSSDKVFELLFQSLGVVISAVDGADSSAHTVSVGLRCINTVELVELSIAVDFNDEDTKTTADKVIQRIEALAVAVQLLPPLPAYQILHCVLELSVFLYILKLGDGGDPERSLQFLDRLCSVISQIGTEDAATSSVEDLWQQWACRMQAKYACLGRSRCQQVLHGIIDVATPSFEDQDVDSS